jgi:predicted nucleic acid-binding protein
MDLVDSSDWVEYFNNGPNVRPFISLIQDTQNLIVPTICVYEVFKKVYGQLGEETVLQAMAQMSFGQVVDMDRDLAVDSAQISTELKLAMADSIILATARAYNAILWTQYVHFKDIPEVKYIHKK